MSGTSAINGANITTTGAQAYTGAVTLGASTTLTTTNSAVTFSSTIDGTTAGSAEPDDCAGQRRGQLRRRGGRHNQPQQPERQRQRRHRHLRSTSPPRGAQAYTGAVTLGAGRYTAPPATVRSPLAAPLTAPRHYTQSLAIAQGSGTVTFGAAVGATVALSSLSVTGSGAITLSGSVTTSGAQTYTGAGYFGGQRTLNSMRCNLWQHSRWRCGLC